MVVSTHFYEIFAHQLIPLDHPNLQLLTMDIMVTRKDRHVGGNMTHEEEAVTFLYRLRSGYCTHSYGQFVARVAGALALAWLASVLTARRP